MSSAFGPTHVLFSIAMVFRGLCFGAEEVIGVACVEIDYRMKKFGPEADATPNTHNHIKHLDC